MKNICICKYCYKYIDSKKYKSIYTSTTQLKNKIYLTNKQQLINNETRCNICNRYINQINNGPDIIKFIDKNKSNNNLILNIARYKVWYFNDIYDNFGYYLREKYLFTHGKLLNIYQAINDLYALPNINTINEKAAFIYNSTIVQNDLDYLNYD